MRSIDGEQYTSTKAIAAAASLHGGMRSRLKGQMSVGAALGILVLLFLAIATYTKFDGAISVERTPVSKPSIAVNAAKSPDVSGAPRKATASDNSTESAGYFPSAYLNRGRDGDGNVMTYEHD